MPEWRSRISKKKQQALSGWLDQQPAGKTSRQVATLVFGQPGRNRRASERYRLFMYDEDVTGLWLEKETTVGRTRVQLTWNLASQLSRSEIETEAGGVVGELLEKVKTHQLYPTMVVCYERDTYKGDGWTAQLYQNIQVSGSASDFLAKRRTMTASATSYLRLVWEAELPEYITAEFMRKDVA